MGPKERRSTVLSAEEEALAVAFRKHTLLPLDDCLYALQAAIPHLTRSSLCWYLQGRIKKTRQAKSNAAKGWRSFSSFEEFTQKKGR